MVDPRTDPIELVEPAHDRWCERFRAERDRVRDALAERGLDDAVVHVAHVGSTAVPDLAAKDVVDLQVVVADDAVDPVARAIEAALGGTRFENTDAWYPVFRRHDGQRFNDHVMAHAGDRWKVSYATREVLRARPDLRREYERLKRDLAAEHDDLADYSAGKTDFVDRLLQVAAADDAVDLDFAVPRPGDGGR